MKIIYEDLNEAYAHGTIFYHSASPREAIDILSSDCFYTDIGDFDEPTMSLSRDPNLHYSSIKSGGGYDVTFALDGAKLSQKYKIKPFDYFYKWGTPGRITQETESEEVLFSKNGVHNIKKYVIGIYIDDDLIKNADKDKGEYKPASGFLSRTGFDSVREYIDSFEEEGIKVYPMSDLKKQHSVRLKQLDKKDKENYSDDEFIKAKSVYKHNQKANKR